MRRGKVDAAHTNKHQSLGSQVLIHTHDTRHVGNTAVTKDKSYHIFRAPQPHRPTLEISRKSKPLSHSAVWMMLTRLLCCTPSPPFRLPKAPPLPPLHPYMEHSPPPQKKVTLFTFASAVFLAVSAAVVAASVAAPLNLSGTFFSWHKTQHSNKQKTRNKKQKTKKSA